MFDFLASKNPVLLAFVGGLFTWGVTLVGASSVFLMTKFSRRITDMMLGFAAGVMMAASVWSLILPSIEISEKVGYAKWFPPPCRLSSGGRIPEDTRQAYASSSHRIHRT